VDYIRNNTALLYFLTSAAVDVQCLLMAVLNTERVESTLYTCWWLFWIL